MRLLTIVLFFCFSSMTHAVIEAYEFETLEQEETYKGLTAELRCLVCQNNNLAESNAELAQDLRKETYDLVNKGMNRDEVVDYMVARYGDFVVYNPPLKSSTFLLWFGPFVLLILILWMLYRQFRKPPVADEAEQQTAKKAKDLLSD